MWLERLSYDKGKGPYHLTSRAGANLPGEWRTKFTFRGFFTRDVFTLLFNDPVQHTMTDVMRSETMTFTFDDRQTAERFDAAFRQLIKRCQSR